MRITDELLESLREDIDANVLTAQEIAEKHNISRRQVASVLDYLRINKAEREAKVRQQKALNQCLSKIADWEGFQEDLKDLTLLNNDVAMKHRITDYVFRVACAYLGVDTKKRKDESKDERSARNVRRRHYRAEMTWRDVSMSGDGRSLEFLKQPWK